MKRLWFVGLACLLLVNSAHAELNIFACEPEWGALASELGGKQVKVFTATTAYQDPHAIEARPSLIAKMRRADLVVCSGAELESGWLPLLIRRSANNKVQAGKPGYFEAAMQVKRLDIPASVDRSLGDIHAAGNPHVHLDPRRVATIANKLSARLGEIDKAHTDHYQKLGQGFQKEWQAAIDKWNLRATPLKGIKVIEHHKNWAYLLDWLDMEAVATLEPKPGVPPGSGHLAGLLQQMKTAPANMTLFTPYQSGKAANWMQEHTGIPAVQLPYTVGGSDRVNDLKGLFDHTLDLLLEAAK